MKKLLFSIIALLSVTVLAAHKPIVIEGKITNCRDRNSASIREYWFNPLTLEEQDSIINFQIAEDGTFYIKLKDADEFYAKYWMRLGNEETHLELIAGDSITMVLNADMFDESIRYFGCGAGRNNYRKDVFLQFWENNSIARINSSDPCEFISLLSGLRDQKLELLNKYFISKEIDSSYYYYEKALIMNEMANMVLINNNTFHHHKYLSGSLMRQMEAILKAADYTDDRVLNNQESRELITNLPEYMQEINSFSHGNELNHEIAFAKAHYTPTMQLYFNKQNIRKYIGQAPNVSQKTVLLNFFDKQFNAPVLKKEIQQQRNSLHSNRIANSEIFQGFAFTIFILVLIVTFLYVLVKMIQFSGRLRIKVNWALLLKIGFYLIAAVTAMGFMGNSNAPLNGFPLVFLMLGTFLVHTYVLIPRYALKRDPHYFILLVVGLIVFLAGNFITNQIAGSLFGLLLLCLVFVGLVMLSWVSYYINQIASKKATLKELISKGDLNREIAFNVVTGFLINLIFIAGIVQDSNRLNPVLLFYAILGLFYFHTFISYPRFFSKQKAIQFVGINVLILLGASIIMIILDAFQSHHALKNIGVVTPLSDLFSTQNIRPDLLMVFSLLLIPSFMYYYIKKQLTSMESTGFKLYRKKEAELAQLKSQVNPHFLFNTLNTLYAFALKEGSDKTAECIAKLANLMRFMLDDMEKESILLKREISYIRDYVKLQSIRSAVEHDIAINVELEEEESHSIAPMLLIPFVENAFKHGMNPNKVSQLKIDIMAKDNHIQFVIENSIDDNFQAYYKEKGFGIGIENVKSRLQHVYPDRHTISIARTNSSFIVILNIEE
ncbi:MAG: sensor histidine kinase [Bacteroidales bacterium]